MMRFMKSENNGTVNAINLKYIDKVRITYR
jgi:hypothetical protein